MDANLSQHPTISVEQIYTVLNNYRIGKKPLAKLLGWGETTIIRYVEGDCPTTEYSDKLLMILGNPGYFYEILLKNKENITSVAYKKSLKAVLARLLQSKICVTAQYIINKRKGNISLYELQYYLYYIQSFSLALTNTPFFEDDFIVNEEEMPYEKVYHDFTIRRICTLEIEEDALAKEEVNFIDDVITAYDWYGPNMMKNLTGYERIMLKLSRDKYNRKIITKDALKNHFLDVASTYGIHSSKDIHKYPDQRFIEIRNINISII